MNDPSSESWSFAIYYKKRIEQVACKSSFYRGPQNEANFLAIERIKCQKMTKFKWKENSIIKTDCIFKKSRGNATKWVVEVHILSIKIKFYKEKENFIF